MTEISFPPLHDLSPVEHETRKQHLLSEIRHEPNRRRFSPPTIPPLRLRFVVPAAAAVGVAAVCAVVFSGALGGSVAHRANTGVWSANAVFPWLTTNVSRNGQAVTSVDAKVQAPWPDATADIYVVRNPDFEKEQFVGGKLVSGPGGQIVFQQQASLNNLISRPTPPADDKWSSTVTLDPSQWDGGCQNAPYAIVVLINRTSDPNSSAMSGSPFFTCDAGATQGSG